MMRLWSTSIRRIRANDLPDGLLAAAAGLRDYAAERGDAPCTRQSISLFSGKIGQSNC